MPRRIEWFTGDRHRWHSQSQRTTVTKGSGRPTPVPPACDTGEPLADAAPLLSPVLAHYMPSAYHATLFCTYGRTSDSYLTQQTHHRNAGPLAILKLSPAQRCTWVIERLAHLWHSCVTQVALALGFLGLLAQQCTSTNQLRTHAKLLPQGHWPQSIRATVKTLWALSTQTSKTLAASSLLIVQVFPKDSKKLANLGFSFHQLQTRSLTLQATTTLLAILCTTPASSQLWHSHAVVTVLDSPSNHHLVCTSCNAPASSQLWHSHLAQLLPYLWKPSLYKFCDHPLWMEPFLSGT